MRTISEQAHIVTLSRATDKVDSSKDFYLILKRSTSLLESPILICERCKNRIRDKKGWLVLRAKASEEGWTFPHKQGVVCNLKHATELISSFESVYLEDRIYGDSFVVNFEESSNEFYLITREHLEGFPRRGWCSVEECEVGSTKSIWKIFRAVKKIDSWFLQTVPIQACSIEHAIWLIRRNKKMKYDQIEQFNLWSRFVVIKDRLRNMSCIVQNDLNAFPVSSDFLEEWKGLYGELQKDIEVLYNDTVRFIEKGSN